MTKTFKKWALIASCIIALVTGSSAINRRQVPPIDLVIHGHWINR